MDDYFSDFGSPDLDLSGFADALNSGADVLSAVGKLVGAVRGIKKELRRQEPATARTGAPWLGEVQHVAAANGDPWVPQRTAGHLGTDLTGVWCPPMNPMDRCAVRQSGRYLNVTAMAGGVPIFVGEGLIDPHAGLLGFAGRYANGSPAAVQARLLPGPIINGVLTVQSPWGYPMSNPLFLQRVQ